MFNNYFLLRQQYLKYTNISNTKHYIQVMKNLVVRMTNLYAVFVQ